MDELHRTNVFECARSAQIIGCSRVFDRALPITAKSPAGERLSQIASANQPTGVEIALSNKEPEYDCSNPKQSYSEARAQQTGLAERGVPRPASRLVSHELRHVEQRADIDRNLEAKDPRICRLLGTRGGKEVVRRDDVLGKGFDGNAWEY